MPTRKVSKVKSARSQPRKSSISSRKKNKSLELGAEILQLSDGELSTAQLKGILDTLPHHIALLDPLGELLMVNEAWLRFAAENGMSRKKAAVGNYLEVCRSAAKSGDEIADVTFKGIQNVIRGKAPRFELDYPCDSLTEKRWFRLNVLPVTLWGDRCALISHSDISPRTKTRRARSA